MQDHAPDAPIFDASLALEPAGPDHWRARPSVAYRMRTGPFGGWVAAILLKAALAGREGAGQPVAMTVNFLAPITADRFEIAVTILRAARTTTFLRVEAWQTGADGAVEVAAAALITLATRRGALSATEIAFPEAARRFSDLEPLVPPAELPGFLHRYEFRYDFGAPLSHQPDMRSRFWVRDRPARDLDWPGLASLCDVPFPRLFLRHGPRFPVATITMTIYFHGLAEDLAETGRDAILFDVSPRAARAGFFDQVAHVWSPRGRLLATTEQLVWFKLDET